MSSKRSRLDTVMDDDQLYVVGGYDGSSQLSSIERYNPDQNTWTAIAGMNVKRSCLGVAIVDK